MELRDQGTVRAAGFREHCPAFQLVKVVAPQSCVSWSFFVMKSCMEFSGV